MGLMRPIHWRAAATASGVRLLAPFLRDQTAGQPVSVMGLDFPNPVGLAAGFDRTGRLAAPLAAVGFGFIEIGTVTRHSQLRLRKPVGIPVGVNIGSPRPGLDDAVIEDYVAALRRVWSFADYLTVNFSSPFLARSAVANDHPGGVDRLFARLVEEATALSEVTGRLVPLTVKTGAGKHGDPLPPALPAARQHGIDGVVLVTDDVRRLAMVVSDMAPVPVIAVGGITNAKDVRDRQSVGAVLVQVYRAFVEGGPRFPRRLLAELKAVAT